MRLCPPERSHILPVRVWFINALSIPMIVASRSRPTIRALVLTHLYPSQSHPNRGLFNLSAVRALAELCDVKVVAPVPWSDHLRRPKRCFSACADASAVIEARRPVFRSLPHAPQFRADWMYRSLRSYLAALRREFPFDIILAAWAYPDVVAAERLSRYLRCPLVALVLGCDINHLAQLPSLRSQIRRALLGSQHVIAVSAALRDRVLDLGVPASRVTVQYNGVDGRQFTLRDKWAAQNRLGLPINGYRVSYIGRLSPEKGPDVLIDAMNQLLRSDPHSSIQLSFVGAGPMLRHLRRRVRGFSLERIVTFHGEQDHRDIPDWISASDVICVPSLREGCPNVILEALASGRPVVASNVGGVPELLDGRNGILVPPGDPDSLAHAIRRVLREHWNPPALRHSLTSLSWRPFGRNLADTLAHVLRKWPRQQSQPAQLSATSPAAPVSSSTFTSASNTRVGLQSVPRMHAPS